PVVRLDVSTRVPRTLYEFEQLAMLEFSLPSGASLLLVGGAVWLTVRFPSPLSVRYRYNVAPIGIVAPPSKAVNSAWVVPGFISLQRCNSCAITPPNWQVLV